MGKKVPPSAPITTRVDYSIYEAIYAESETTKSSISEIVNRILTDHFKDKIRPKK